jgi:shikimate dehydrogenase
MPDQLNGASRLYPIVGDPISYVESPARLTITFQKREHNGICIPMHVTRQDLPSVMAALSATDNVDGILVTMPHKFEALKYCATSSDRARSLGVVSVIRRNPDYTWHGDMLDGTAFVTAQRTHGARIDGSRALLVGAGAAGRAIAIALFDGGIRELVVHDAAESRVTALCQVMAQLGGNTVKTGPPDPSGCDLVFNATPLGMNEGDPLPVNPDLLTSSMFVGDVIAGHGVTPFIRAAQEAGCTTAGGDDMVDAGQGLMAEFFLGT